MVASHKLTAAPTQVFNPWPYHKVEWVSTAARLFMDGERRMEAEAYLTDGYGIRLSVEARPAGWSHLDQLASVSQPPRTKATLVSPEFGKPFLTATQIFDLRPFPRKWLSVNKIGHADALTIKEGAILITRSGAVGRAALAFAPHQGVLISDDLLRVHPTNPIAWGWLYAYLRAPKVRAMMKSARYGHIIKHLEVGHLNALPIPRVDSAIMENFTQQVKRILQLRDEAFGATLQAEAHFEACLGAFQAPDMGERGFEIRASDLAFTTGRRRMEAAYHSPSTASLNRHMGTNGRSMSVISKDFDVHVPGRYKRVPATNGVTFLDSSDLFEINPDLPKRLADGRFGDGYQGRVQTGWILMASSGQVYGIVGGAVLASSFHVNKVVANHVIRIIPWTHTSMRPGYLMTALTHPTLGRPIVKALTFGHSVPEIDPDDLAKLKIVRLDQRDEDQIADLAEKSADLRGKADIIENDMAAEAEAILDRFIDGEDGEVAGRFTRLAEQWKHERPRGTDVAQMVEHPAYQEIIKMGQAAVPLILGELERQPDHWFAALHIITGANPVPPVNQGRLKDMAVAWLAWGKRRGYKW